MKHWLRAALAAQVLAWSGGHAETAPPAPADPADPKAEVPQSKYESAFDGYRRHDDAKRLDWREANDEAAILGGHMGQLRGRAPAPREAAPRIAPGAKPAGGAR